MAKYQIKLKNNTQLKSWHTLEENIPEAMNDCKSFLEESPLDRPKSQGKLKKLKGKLNGFLQYDITNSARVQYTVDNTAHIVYIDYIGNHP